MIEQLFGSKTRVKLLQLFYGNPNRSFYVREITRKIDEQINSVRRELSNLLNIGIIVSDTTNNKLYYEVNQKFEHYESLLAIFGDGSKKTTSGSAKAKVLNKDDLKQLGHVDLAVYTGQFTRDESTGVDLLLAGEVNPNSLKKFISALEAKEGKEIRYIVMKTTDFVYRKQIKDRFVSNIMLAKKQVLVDSQNLLEQQ